MFGKRVSIGTSVATVLAVSVATIGAGAAIAGSTEPPAWQKGLHARSAGLNQKYGLGQPGVGFAERSAGVSSVAQPDWLRALELRSEAMNAPLWARECQRHDQHADRQGGALSSYRSRASSSAIVSRRVSRRASPSSTSTAARRGMAL